MPVAATFDFRDEDGFSLSDLARIDTMVTVVDAFNFHRDYPSTDRLKTRGEHLGEDDERTVANLLIDQIAIRTWGSNRVVKTVGASPWTTAPTAMETLADEERYTIT